MDGIIPLRGIWMRGLRLAQCNKRLREELVARLMDEMNGGAEGCVTIEIT